MKKIYLLLWAITYSIVGFSQNNLGSSNDEARISLLAVFPQQVIAPGAIAVSLLDSAQDFAEHVSVTGVTADFQHDFLRIGT